MYNLSSETEYMYRETHRIRGELAMGMIINEATKVKKRNQYKILSVACSVGIYESVLVKNGYEVHGIDGAKNALQEAEKRGLLIKTGDVNKPLPYHNATFDCVFAGDVIEHLFLVKPFLNEISRVLKPNGIFVVTTPNLAALNDRIRFLFGASPRNVAPIHEYLYLHIRPFTFKSLRDTLQNNGFKVEDFKSNIVELYIGKHSLKSRTLAKLFPELGLTLVIKARKS